MVANPFSLHSNLLSIKNSHAHVLAHAAHLPAQCVQVNWTGVLLHRGKGRTPLLKTEQSAHLVCTSNQLDVGQDLKNLIPRNSFFRILSGVWVVVISWILGFVSGYFLFGLGTMGFGEGDFALVFYSINFFLPYILLPCYYASSGPAAKSFSQQSSETEIADLNLTSIKNGERSSKSNITNSFSCTVCRHHATKSPHSRVNNLEPSWSVFCRRSHTGKQCVQVQKPWMM